MTFQFRKAEPWESQEIVWWNDFKAMCTYRDYLDDRICDHAENKLAHGAPDACKVFQRVLKNPEKAGEIMGPPPLPKKPDYYRVRSDLVLCGTLPTTTWDERKGSETKEDILDDLLPELNDGEILEKMVIYEEYKKCR